MTYLRLRNSRRTKSVRVPIARHVKALLEVEPAQDLHPPVAAVAIRARRTLVVPAIAEACKLDERAQTGTLHRPVHGAWTGKRTTLGFDYRTHAQGK